MALNPFFLQGSQSEQRLIQELINEQLTIYGVEVIYLPRTIINHDNILNDIQSSKFNDNFAIEAYVNTYDGYGGAGDIMTKFGMSLKDELTLTISKERYEDFIATFVSGVPPTYESHTGLFNQTGDDFVTTRPREGDLVYFPLGKRLFEVKFVEHEQPFYQLGKNYVYQLKCELFEYEDEMNSIDSLSTGSEEIDDLLADTGFITSLILVGASSTATATTQASTGYVRSITLNDDGYGYTSTPTVSFTASPEGNVDANATAVAITTVRNNVYSIKEILLTNAGVGYTETPTITISGGGGVGASATCSIETSLKGIRKYTITDNGSGYTSVPTITIPTPVGPGAAATATVGSAGTITTLTLSTGGKFYGSAPNVIIDSPPTRSGVATTVSLSNSSGTDASVSTGSGYSDGEIYETTATTGSGIGLKVQVSVSGAEQQINGVQSILYGGYGYVTNDIVQVVGGSNDGYLKIGSGVTTGIGTTALATPLLESGVVTGFNITNSGSGYTTVPNVSIANTVGDKDYVTSGLTTATARVVVSTSNNVSAIYITDPGIGYTAAPSITISSPTSGIGTFQFNEVVTGSLTGATGRVKSWDGSTNTLNLGATSGTFGRGDTVVGSASSASYKLSSIKSEDVTDKYDKGDEIEIEADTLLDFTETNPFGTY